MTVTNLTDLEVGTLQILEDLGIPMSDLTKRRKVKMAKAVLALCDLRVGKPWSATKSISDNHAYLSRDIIRYMNEHLGESIADSSYDDIRRKDLLLPVEAGIVLKAAINKSASTNDGTRKYALSDEAAEIFRSFNTSQYANKVSEYFSKNVTLKERLNREREMLMVPVRLSTGEDITFSAGEHNQLQKSIIEEFLPRFGFAAEVLYVGDTADKFLYLKSERLKELGFFELSHDKLPDVVAYSKEKNWLYLIEAVHASNPITEMRKLILDQLTKDLGASIVYVTAFNDRNVFRKFAKDIAWETEVWIADNPSHMIHFNGDKFLGPHK
jgi:BsuBI/PstI restriction endonuclease domain/BsuBI/PstI restriction endonuclease HTH domain